MIIIINDKILTFCFRYAKVDVVASAPIVPFRETVVVPPKIDMANEVVENHNQVTILTHRVHCKSIIVIIYSGMYSKC